MSRADPFDAFYRESRERLMHQIFAFAGNLDVAKRALADGYVSAAQHWSRAQRDPDAWVRVHAFRAASRRRNRSREPWYRSAQRIADEHRPLLSALAGLTAPDRHLLIARELAGLDLAPAAREVGIPESDAGDSIERSTAALGRAGVAPAEIPQALLALRDDLPTERVNAASRLRARGRRRRAESWVLVVGAAVLVVAVAAGSINLARRPGPSTGPASPASSSTKTTASVQPPAPRVARTDLARIPQLRAVEDTNTWALDSTTADFGSRSPVDACLDAAPTTARAAHYWTRVFSSGRSGITVRQALEVARTVHGARAAYASQLQQFGTCVAGSHRVVTVKSVRRVGDQASLIALQYAQTGTIRTERVAIGRTGSAVTTLVVDEPHLRPVSQSGLVRLLGSSVDKLCADSGGTCATPPYRTRREVPPPDPVAPGFLSTVDLPLFPGLDQSWVATRPAPTVDNPSATECDRTDFTAGGASGVEARSFVIPAAGQLPGTFGMTETVGTFPSSARATSFVGTAASTVAGCSARQLTLSVSDTGRITTSAGSGYAWRIALQTSQTTTLVFRVALVRVGATVAEVTFTPGGGYDVDPAGFVTVANRAAGRLTQL